ncbi:MAG TPA: pantoate--beta-alanine ligase [Rhizomicrobium sp.]|jgi:pantoate--beta-alanine ligase|nr:pantoate--beta-alanine ligase [Rhizomicrobium sp.]
MKTPGVITTVAGLRAEVAKWRREGSGVGLVPTMGALHAGHLSLVTEAGQRAERVIVSIFVNPAQFAPHEDFDSYPRDLVHDLEGLAAQGLTDIVFAPPVSELYPGGFATRIEMVGPALGLEEDFRPHFFSGVATIVAKLLIAANPHVAVFGEKDYQQLLVIRRLVGDLGLDVDIIGAPIMREADGLAMSSRNAYLDRRQREVAGLLNRILADVAARVREGTGISAAEKSGADALRAAGFDSVDYVAVRDANTLAKLDCPAAGMRVLAAATIGKTRLIDNRAVRDSNL